MAMFFIPAAISLIPAAFEGIGAVAAVVAGGLAAYHLLEDRQESLYAPPPSPPQRRPPSPPRGLPPSSGATSLIPAAVAGGLVAYQLLKDPQEPPQRPPPSPPRRRQISKEDLKKLAKKAMKGLIKTILKEAEKKIREKIIEDKESSNYKQENVNAWGPMENQTQMVEMKLKDQHVWCGHFKSGPPPNNRKNETAIDKVNKNPADVIWHRGVPPSGSKAAVAYSAHSRQWILAWHVPLRSSSSSANKIYVECGPERPIDWNVIEKRLDASSNESECDGAVAEITDGADARIAAIFYE